MSSAIALGNSSDFPTYWVDSNNQEVDCFDTFSKKEVKLSTKRVENIPIEIFTKLSFEIDDFNNPAYSKLSKIKNLKRNWGVYRSKKICDEVIFNCYDIVGRLNSVFSMIPDVTPTYRNSIDLELDIDNGYINIEVFSDRFILFYKNCDIKTVQEYPFNFLSINSLINNLSKFLS